MHIDRRSRYYYLFFVELAGGGATDAKEPRESEDFFTARWWLVAVQKFECSPNEVQSRWVTQPQGEFLILHFTLQTMWRSRFTIIYKVHSWRWRRGPRAKKVRERKRATRTVVQGEWSAATNGRGYGRVESILHDWWHLLRYYYRRRRRIWQRM